MPFYIYKVWKNNLIDNLQNGVLSLEFDTSWKHCFNIFVQVFIKIRLKTDFVRHFAKKDTIFIYSESLFSVYLCTISDIVQGASTEQYNISALIHRTDPTSSTII